MSLSETAGEMLEEGDILEETVSSSEESSSLTSAEGIMDRVRSGLFSTKPAHAASDVAESEGWPRSRAHAWIGGKKFLNGFGLDLTDLKPGVPALVNMVAGGGYAIREAIGRGEGSEESSSSETSSSGPSEDRADPGESLTVDEVDVSQL